MMRRWASGSHSSRDSSQGQVYASLAPQSTVAPTKAATVPRPAGAATRWNDCTRNASRHKLNFFTNSVDELFTLFIFVS